ncbi:MAG: DNA ligase-associated DEXH box helicase, partial [Limnobacter sp.]|nr:DNA ligase-associated DEXH box helicase [Limnobacter sp.]
REVKQTKAYEQLTQSQFDWALSFVEKGGDSLKAYPDFQRVVADEEGVYRVPRRDLARRHVMSVGTIVSDSSMSVAWMKGGKLGTIEEGFIARLKTGDCFSFAGRILELVKVRDMTAYVKRASRKKAIVPNWVGGKMPLSTELAQASLTMLQKVETALEQGGRFSEPELQALSGLFEIQDRWSALPTTKSLLVETLESKEGWHLFVYPFAGRMVHTGLASLLAWRISQAEPATFSLSMNDYGFELLSAQPIDWARYFAEPLHLNPLLSVENLLDDVIECLNASELAQRRFREIARVSGLVFQGFPGSGKSTRQIQASSGLFFDVFKKYDQDNQLLLQAQREALEQELDIERMQMAMQDMHSKSQVFKEIKRPSPFAFPLLIERLRETVSSESLNTKVARMVADLEKAAQC